MCGLVGGFSPANFSLSERNMLTHMLEVDEVRGVHSTGVALVYNKVDGGQFTGVYKKAIPARDFTQLRGYTNLLNATNITVFSGHNRHATLGSQVAANAHPFQHGSITLVHNGTLKNKHEILDTDNTSRFDTDSETICFGLSLCSTTEEVKTFIEGLSGAYALIWYDSRDATINFARNSERDLYLGRSTTNRDMWWASEEGLLSWEMDRSNVPNIAISLLPVGSWVKVKAKKSLAINEEAETVTEFTPKKLVTVTHHYGGHVPRTYQGPTNVSNRSVTINEVGRVQGSKPSELLCNAYRGQIDDIHHMGVRYWYYKVEDNYLVDFKVTHIDEKELQVTGVTTDGHDVLVNYYNKNEIKVQKGDVATGIVQYKFNSPFEQTTEYVMYCTRIFVASVLGATEIEAWRNLTARQKKNIRKRVRNNEKAFNLTAQTTDTPEDFPECAYCGQDVWPSEGRIKPKLGDLAHRLMHLDCHTYYSADMNSAKQSTNSK